MLWLWKHFLIVLILKRYAVHFINNISQDRIRFTKNKVTPIYSLFQKGKSLAYLLNPIPLVTIIGVEWRYTIAILIHSKCLNCSKGLAGSSNLHLIEEISTNNSNLADIDDKYFFSAKIIYLLKLLGLYWNQDVRQQCSTVWILSIFALHFPSIPFRFNSYIIYLAQRNVLQNRRRLLRHRLSGEKIS